MLHSILFLVCVFISAGLQLITSGLPFFGFLFIIIYVGAVSMLFLFIIMMIRPVYKNYNFWLPSFSHWKVSVMLLSVVYSLKSMNYGFNRRINMSNYIYNYGFDSVPVVKFLLMGDGWLQLLILGILLSIAMFGAYIITKKISISI